MFGRMELLMRYVLYCLVLYSIVVVCGIIIRDLSDDLCSDEDIC